MSKRLLAAAGVAAACVLVACGGGSGTGGVAASAPSGGTGGSSTSSASNSSNSSSSSSSANSQAPEASPVVSSAPVGYRLVWADEFNGSGAPDPKKWGYDTGANSYSVKNGEAQYYAANRLENVHQDGGYLHITARKEDMTGWPSYQDQHYSAGRIYTKGLASWTYGFFEIRARMTCASGLWPAIWTLGTTGGWPAGGEIDILEAPGATPVARGTIHNDAYKKGDGDKMTISDGCTAFHNYQMKWTADAIEISVDNVVYKTYTNAHTTTGQWPFDKAQYLLLNMAMGGWSGVVDEAALPRDFLIDYVRVYQKN